MSRNPGSESAAQDQAQASREEAARNRLLVRGADSLGLRPWRPAPVPPSAVDLAHFALWRSVEGSPDDIRDGLSLLPAARAEVDGLETGLLFAARSAGLTWTEIADAMGFRSPQACQQHFQRLTARGAGS